MANSIPTRTEASVKGSQVFNINNLYVVDDSSDTHPFFFIIGGTDYFWGMNVNAAFDTNGLQLVTTLSQGGDAILGLINVVKLPLAAVDTGGGIFAWAVTINSIINRVVVDVATVASSACTLDIGYTATNATTLSDTLIDGIDVHSATGQFDNLLAANAGTNGKTAVKAAAGKWVTGSTASGASAALVGSVYIYYNLS